MTIDSAQLGNAVNIRLVGAFLLPESAFVFSTRSPNYSERYTERRYRQAVEQDKQLPYPAGQPQLWQWSRRVPAVGATIEPGEQYQLVVQVTRDSAAGPGISRTIDLRYHDDQASYERIDPNEIELGIRSQDCGNRS